MPLMWKEASSISGRVEYLLCWEGARAAEDIAATIWFGQNRKWWAFVGKEAASIWAPSIEIRTDLIKGGPFDTKEEAEEAVMAVVMVQGPPVRE